MTRNPLLAFATFALLCACSTPPTLTTPDGRKRTSVNSQAAIDAYNASISAETTVARDTSQTAAQLDSVKRDIVDLKSYMTAVAARLNDMSALDSGATYSSQPKPVTPAHVAAISDPRKTSEAVRSHGQAIIFRITLGPGETGFAPSAPFGDVLLHMARAGSEINIRAASDSNVDTPANEKVVNARAQQARQYLTANGIPADKIRTTIYRAGAFVSENATAHGKARNRRTEIEVSGIDTNEIQSAVRQFGEVTR